MKIAVIGDCAIDWTIEVEAKKLCSEAPIPVFHEKSESFSLGMAGNVAAMCKSLGAEVLLCGVCGDGDHGSDGDILENLVYEKEIAFSLIPREFVTTVKKRYFDVRDGQRHLVARFDRDCQHQCTPEDERFFYERIKDFNPDAVIIQDHGKGVVTAGLVDRLALAFACYIDPCRRTPIPKERVCLVGSDEEIDTDNSVRTRNDMVFKMGAGGIGFYPAMSNQFDFLIPAYCKRPVESCGAGDQFLAELVVERIRGRSWKEACHLASIAAAIQVGRVGMAPVTIEEIHAYQIGTM